MRPAHSTAVNRPTWYIALLFFGIFCSSTAVILIRANTEQPVLVAAVRLLVAALALSPVYFYELRHTHQPYGWQQVSWSVLPALILAVNFISWVVGARMTQVASASLIGNMTPVAMPFFMWGFYREKITRFEILGTFLTLVGLAILSSSSLSLSRTNFTGDLLCLFSMLTFVGYLALGKKNGPRISFWLYVIPIYFIAGMICLACALFFVNPVKAYTLPNILYLLGLGLIPTVIGHSILNRSMQVFRGQVVSVSNLSQPIFSGLMAFFIFHEKPPAVLYLSAPLILAGVLVVLFADSIRRTGPAGQPVVQPLSADPLQPGD